MPVSFVPPFLKKLAAPTGPLVDDREIHQQLAQLKAQAERTDRQSKGDLFAGPLAQPLPPSTPPAVDQIAIPSDGADTRYQRPTTPEMPPEPVAPPAPVPLAGPGPGVYDQPLPGANLGVVAPPEAPPPPPPADRPPGTFDQPAEPSKTPQAIRSLR